MTPEEQEEHLDEQIPVTLGAITADGRRPINLKESDEMAQHTPPANRPEKMPFVTTGPISAPPAYQADPADPRRPEPMSADEYNRRSIQGEDPLTTTNPGLPTGSAPVADPDPIITAEDLHPAGELCPTCGQRLPSDAAILKQTLDLVISAGVTDQVVPYFYGLLFQRWANLAEQEPDNPRWNNLRNAFPKDMNAQHEKVLSAVVALCTHYGDDETNSEDPELLERQLVAMGRAHVRFDLEVGDYADVGTALLFTLKHFAGPAWTPSVEAAWKRAYKYMAGVMLEGESRPNTGGVGRRRASR